MFMNTVMEEEDEQQVFMNTVDTMLRAAGDLEAVEDDSQPGPTSGKRAQPHTLADLELDDAADDDEVHPNQFYCPPNLNWSFFFGFLG